MRTLYQLMKNTPPEVVARSKQTSATVMKASRLRKRDLDAIVFTVRCRAITEKVFYDVVVELYPNEVHRNVWEKPSVGLSAWVKCSCPYFLYHCEYALAKFGSSEIDYSNGKPPHIMNPNQTPYLCKHLYRAAPEAVKAAQSVSNAKVVNV